LEEEKEICRGVLGREPTCQVSKTPVCGGDEGAEVAEGCWDIMVEAAEFPGRAYVVP
jgi:hypothetical protein